MRLALLANRASGGSTDPDDLARRLRARGAQVDLHDVRELGPAEGLSGPAPDRIVVAGGDGSLGSAAMLAQRLGVPMAVLPSGTANDFARALGLPRGDDDAAVALAADPDARTREVEIGSAAGRPFLNAASAGLSVAAAKVADPLKRRLGPLAYAAGALTAAARESPLHVVVRVDGEERFAGDAWQVVVACTGHFGGGSSIGGTDAEDGRLDVAVIPAGPRVVLAFRALGLRLGRLTDQRAVADLRGRSIEIDGVSAFNVDGEACSVTPARFGLAGRVRVVVP